MKYKKKRENLLVKLLLFVIHSDSILVPWNTATENMIIPRSHLHFSFLNNKS